jgi:endoglucanase
MSNAPSLEIKVDQAGYSIGTTKVAFLVQPVVGQTARFILRRQEDGKAFLEGSWTPSVFDPDSGDRVQTADFSSWNRPGVYYLDVHGIGRSWPFRIAADVYQRAYYLTARSFYGQRCGTAVDLGPEYPGYYHDACHKVGAFDSSSGRDDGDVPSKGWHDAGDYGRYIVNSGIATATLLWAFELWGKGGIQDVSLHLPESGNGIPDLLNEIRWNLDWMLGMQDADGGVWHKQTSAHFCGFISPDKDDLPSLVIGAGKRPFKTSCATGDFGAVMAIAARVFSPYDHDYANRCLVAARKAWQWLGTNEEVLFRNPTGITTGEYGDVRCSDEQLWAAAELARTTGELPFDSYFIKHYKEFLDGISADEPPSNSDMSAFALWTYALGEGRNEAVVQEIKSRSIAAALSITKRTESHGYRISMTTKNYIWGSNGVAANYSLQLLIANRFQRNRRFVQAAAGNVHYLLGRNPFSLSYVTQLGSNPVRHIHHRPSAAANLSAPWPGLLSGGPNAKRDDPELQLLPATTPPARTFLDRQNSYGSNEVAINWNAALVFALAGLLSD